MRWRLCLCVASLAIVVASCGGGSPATTAAVERVTGGPTGSYVVDPGIHKIKHIVIIMQENRSFDSYFGTFPGADGIPATNGVPTVCVNDPQTGQCVHPLSRPRRCERGWAPLARQTPRRTSTAAR